MGNSCCQKSSLKRQKLALLLVGLDNAGKTVAARGLAGDPIDSPIPTIGFSVTELKYHKYDVKIFDLGGGPNIRGIWYKYFVDVHGIIFVLDSCDSDRFKEARNVLEEILSNDKITGKPLLILANKQDQESAFDEIDIIECLKIEELVNKFKCPTLVQSCCANEMNYTKSDPGIQKGYQWIMDYIDKNYEQLNIRVQMDVVEQELKEKEELLMKIERIKAARQALINNDDPDAIQTFSEYVSKMNNGDAPKDTRELGVLDFFPNPEEHTELDNDTSNSSITFPEVYFVNNYTSETERPRSAMQVVKHQLQMNNELKRSQSAKTRRNKTAPVNVPAAKEFIPMDSRHEAKKAGNIVIENGIYSRNKNHMGPGGDFYPTPGFSPEQFELRNRFEVKKLPPVRVKSQVQINKEDDSNGICVIDVE